LSYKQVDLSLASSQSPNPEVMVIGVDKGVGAERKAIVAMTRRQAFVPWRMSLSGEPYRDAGLAPDPQN